MKLARRPYIIAALLLVLTAATVLPRPTLPSWNEGNLKKSIMEFVALAKFEKRLVEAKVQGWTVVDMKNEWKIIIRSRRNRFEWKGLYPLAKESSQ